MVKERNKPVMPKNFLAWRKGIFPRVWKREKKARIKTKHNRTNKTEFTPINQEGTIDFPSPQNGHIENSKNAVIPL